MKHRVFGRRLNRSSKHRKQLFKNLALGLIENGYIKTTEAKAKSIKGLVDKLITRAKKNNLHSRRLLFSFFNQKKAVNKLVDEIAPRFKSRKSGFTRIVRLSSRRGDNTTMASLEFIDNEPTGKKPTEAKAKDIKKPSKKSKGSVKSLPQSQNQSQAKPKQSIKSRVKVPRTTHK